MIAVVIVGILLAAMGGLLLLNARLEASKAECFQATIIGLREKTVSKGVGVQKLYCPVVKFKMYGTERTAEHYKYVNLNDYRRHEGDSVKVCINRSKAKTFYFADEGAPSSGGLALAVAGALVAVVGGVLMIIL